MLAPVAWCALQVDTYSMEAVDQETLDADLKRLSDPSTNPLWTATHERLHARCECTQAFSVWRDIAPPFRVHPRSQVGWLAAGLAMSGAAVSVRAMPVLV
jgi:hypothetical protein